MIDLKDKPDFREGDGDSYDSCVICGPIERRAVIHFDSGSTEPTVDETITGATTSDTGVVENYQLESGTWAGGDAVGTIVVTSPSGYNADSLAIFQDDENLNGSTAGSNFATVKGEPGVIQDGRIYPEWMLVEYRGNKYCRDHFYFKFKREWLDDQGVDISEKDRSK